MTWALHTDLDLESLEVHALALDDAGLLGVVEADGRATAYLAARVDLPVAGRWEEIPDADWNEVWKRGMEPVQVGEVVITPPWRATGAGEEVVIDPGQAFGTGHHETTTGCAAALADLPLEGRAVVDVGTGTGVLAIIAARRGAAPVVAVDVDPLAVEATQVNARVNGVDVDVRLGSADAVVERTYDVVVANLDTDTLSRLAGELAGLLAPDGALVASGVGLERQAEAVAALAGAGLTTDVRPGEEWVVLLARHAGA